VKILKTKLGPITLNSLAKKLFLKTPRRKENFKVFIENQMLLGFPL
jgi:hypothetical protein